MNFLELAKTRRSVRDYADKPVSRAQLEQVLEAGRLAPSACNRQPWRLVVATEAADRERLSEAYGGAWLRQAPVVIVICANREAAWRRGDGKLSADVDAAIVTDHMTLAAAELGLGTCWICAFDAARLSAILKLGPEWEPIVMLPLGHPAAASASSPRTSRKELAEIVQWGI